MGEERLLDPSQIPETLWSSTQGLLYIPDALCRVYQELIAGHGLTELAKAGALDGPVGGLTKEKTDEHFAQAFSGSAARILLAVLDPKDEVGLTSNTFIESAAGASLCMTDAPCGAGAAAAVFLCALAELRAKSVLPRMPLEVRLIGGEISPHAIEYAEEIMARLEPILAEQAINLKYDFLEWDVTCRMSTTDLVKRCIIDGNDRDRRLLVVANFSGFLERERKREEARAQLNELFRYASSDQSNAIWIEPQTNEATAEGGLLKWLKKNLSTSWRPFARERSSAKDAGKHLLTEAKFQHPLDFARKINVRLAIVPITLERA